MNDGMFLGLEYYLISNDSAALRPSPTQMAPLIFQLSTINETFLLVFCIEMF